MVNFEINEDEPTECDKCGVSLVNEGCCGYIDEEEVEKTICLMCAQIMALKYEYPFNTGE